MAKILVVEDDYEMNHYIAMTLRMEGYEVQQAPDGSQALQRLQEFAPDLILSDVEMPHLGGIPLAKELQKHTATANIPIIFVTGRRELEARVRGLEYSVDYIVKPFETPELIARVRAALRMHNLEMELRATNEQLAQANEKLEAVNLQLEQLALTDELTRVCNRRGFEKFLEDEVRRAQRFQMSLAVVIFDLDHFKNINDTWGHAQGDKVLQEFARLLREVSRHIDTVARYGGEEFVVVLPATDTEGALAFAEKARVATEEAEIERVTNDGEMLSPLRVTVSGGVASVSDWAGSDDVDFDNLFHGLIRAADQRLYEAKESGRNRVIGGDVAVASAVALGTSH